MYRLENAYVDKFVALKSLAKGRFIAIIGDWCIRKVTHV